MLSPGRRRRRPAGWCARRGRRPRRPPRPPAGGRAPSATAPGSSAERRADDALGRRRAVADHRDRRLRRPAVLDQRRGDRRRGVHAHEDDDRAAQPGDRRPVDQRLRMPRRQVPGDDDELVGEAAVGHRDAGQRGDGDRAGDARAPPRPARPRPRTPRAPPCPRPKTNGSPPLSRTTRRPASACSTSSALICSCAIDRPRGSFEASMTSTSVGSEDSSDRGARWSATTTSACATRLAAAHGDQPRVAGPAADEDDAAAPRPPAAVRDGAVGDAAVGQPGDDGVPHPDRALRVAAAVHADDEVAVPADGGRPDARGGPVVGAGAEDVAPARPPRRPRRSPPGRRWPRRRTRRRRGRRARSGGGARSASRGSTSASRAGVTSGLTTVTRAPASSRPATRRWATWPPPTTTTRRSWRRRPDRVDDPGLRVDGCRVHALRIAADCFVGSGP